MKIKVEKKLLSEALVKVSRAISARTVIPVLSGILIEANETGLTFTGSDSDISIRTHIPVEEDQNLEIDLGGSIVLPAKELVAIVKSLPSDVEMETTEDGNKVKIYSGKSKFTLNGTSAKEYPQIKLNGDQIFVINADQLSDLIKKTIFATSKLETRPVLTGVNIFNENGRIGAVSTDAHRLSKLFSSGDGNSIASFDSVTIPSSGIKELTTLFKGDITVSKTDNNIRFSDQNTDVLIRLLSGDYPETDRLIPTDFSTIVTVNKSSFLESLERSAILTEDNIATFEVTNKSGGIFETIVLKQKNGELGSSQEEIIVDEIEGEEIGISFNARYVIEALKAFDSETVVFQFSGNMKPFIVRPKDYTTEDVIQLVLPVRKY